MKLKETYNSILTSPAPEFKANNLTYMLSGNLDSALTCLPNQLYLPNLNGLSS